MEKLEQDFVSRVRAPHLPAWASPNSFLGLESSLSSPSHPQLPLPFLTHTAARGVFLSINFILPSPAQNPPMAPQCLQGKPGLLIILYKALPILPSSPVRPWPHILSLLPDLAHSSKLVPFCSLCLTTHLIPSFTSRL